LKDQKRIIAVQIVVDTNVFINAIGKSSPYRWLFDKIISREFTLCISNDIFYEYWEVLEEQTTTEIADNIANFLVTIPSVKFIQPFISWNLITADPDDNKFADCAITSGAECIITHDRHFNVLKKIQFPVVKVFTPEEFNEIYNKKITGKE
jgi:putative PIN family toxin of toxin-antitoxin system